MIAEADERPAELFTWLERVRGTWGWTQRQLADACKVSPNQLRNYRDGQRPGDARLAAIAAGVGVPVEWLHRVMRGEQVAIPPHPPTLRSVPLGPEDVVERLGRLEETVGLLVDAVLRQRHP